MCVSISPPPQSTLFPYPTLFRSADAYENVVDRLLASPRYGERWAWDWLDVARYADTNGFQGDPERTMWPWRDWVVRSEEHTSELQSLAYLVCRLLLEKNIHGVLF